MSVTLSRMWSWWDTRRRLVPVAGVGIILMFVAVVSSASYSTAKLSHRAHRARVGFEGLSRVDLEVCAGRPVRIQNSGDWEYLTYLGPPTAKGQDAGRCIATFMMLGGYVQGLAYENTSGGLIGKSITGCPAIVDPCFKRGQEGRS